MFFNFGCVIKFASAVLSIGTYEIWCALVFASEAKIEIEAKISFEIVCLSESCCRGL
jgi:hypothetical protein